jgi:Glycosyl transferase family 2
MSSVDVIVPCYNYGHFLRECVGSVLAQSVARIRVLIIDDASPDNTSEVAAELTREDPRVTFLKHESNKGHIATYNEGIEWASADYMLILSADDYLLPGALQRAARLMDQYPAVGFTFGNAIRLDESGVTRPIDSVTGKADWRIVDGLQFIELNGASNIVPTPTAVIRTQLQRRVGGYRAELPHAGDMEMWLRLAAHGSVGMLKPYQAVYRRHAGNMSLDYMTAGFLPEVQQRKAAVDSFFRSCGHLLPNSQKLERKFQWLLGRTALGLASSAFDKGQRHVSEQLADFACQTCPNVTRSLSWAKLACRRILGYQAWHGLQSAVARGHRIKALLEPSVETRPLCACRHPELSQAVTVEGDPAPRATKRS